MVNHFPRTTDPETFSLVGILTYQRMNLGHESGKSSTQFLNPVSQPSFSTQFKDYELAAWINGPNNESTKVAVWPPEIFAATK